MSNNPLGRKKSILRFRPRGGLGRKGPKPIETSPGEFRERVISEQALQNEVFESRHREEIEQAEAKAAQLVGVQAEGKELSPTRGDETTTASLGEARACDSIKEPEKPYEPVKIQEELPKGLVEKIKMVAGSLIDKVQNLIGTRPRVHKEIIVNVQPLETRVALLEDGRLEELAIERATDERLVGSIYKGVVRNLEDSIKAAFVDIGFEKNAFLHYWDIIPANLDSSVEIVEREGPKREKPKITIKDIPRLYPVGTEIVVQVVKGPIGTKGPRVTTNLVIPGRYLVLLPNSDQCGISRKIEDPQERKRLKKIIQELNIPEGMGIIVRTAGEGKQKRYFVRDLAMLIELWRRIQEQIREKPAPFCVFHEPDLVERTVRDFLTDDIERVVVDDANAYQRMVELVSQISPRSAQKIKLYNEPEPVFDRFNITAQMERTFSRRVPLKSGGYITIDETEALVAVDVNTGSHKAGSEEESAILQVNLEAAEEICRQLRLRNIGGIIVIDFIDMKSKREQQMVFEKVKQLLKRDKARTHVLPISPLGLMELTRQRHTESFRETMFDPCPYCHGLGRIKSPITMSIEIQRKVLEILRRRQRDESDFHLKIFLHPLVLDRIRREDEKYFIELEKRYFARISFRGDNTLHVEQFRIVNAITGEELSAVGFNHEVPLRIPNDTSKNQSQL